MPRSILTECARAAPRRREHSIFARTAEPSSGHHLAENAKVAPFDAGVRVVLGTDSRASNPDLNVWAEAQFVAERYVKLSRERILAMVTTDAAESLGCQIAQLAVGDSADFTVIRGLPIGDSSDAWERLLSTATFPSDVWYRGRSLGAAN